MFVLVFFKKRFPASDFPDVFRLQSGPPEGKETWFVSGDPVP